MDSIAGTKSSLTWAVHISVAFLVVVVFALLGKLIEAFFGFGMPAFRIAAGIIVFAVGYKMLSGESHGAQVDTGNHSHPSLDVELDKAISPLALPMPSPTKRLSMSRKSTRLGAPMPPANARTPSPASGSSRAAAV